MKNLKFLNSFNLFYGLTGLALIFQFGANGAWKSFLAGWLVSVINFELLKRIGVMLAPLYSSSAATKVNPFVYFLMIGKFAFWGLVIALFAMTSGIQAIPFVIGVLTILAAGLGLGVREIIYGTS